MGNSESLELKQPEKCVVLKPNAHVLRKLRRIKVPTLAAEVVFYLRCSENIDVVLELEQLLEATDIQRLRRGALLTQATLQLNRFSTLLSNDKKSYPHVLVNLRDIRAIRVDNDIVLVTHQPNNVNMQEQQLVTVVYQTAHPLRLLMPLAQAVQAAYCGVPHWAVPVKWRGQVLPAAVVFKPVGDGGFSHCYFPVILAHRIATAQNAQELAQYKLRVRGDCIDIVKLVDSWISTKDFRPFFYAEALKCLAFNLHFRTLIARNISKPHSNFGHALSRVLLYNVTLRELDLTGTNLHGLGESLGQALAMNIQPLFSKLNFSSCRLDSRDWRGLIPGLARLWCGGSALAESLTMERNPSISTAAWTVFFDVLRDPKLLPFWPSQPPPPPNLGFLQHLSLLDVQPPGPGLARLIPKLTGLRTLKLNGYAKDVAVVAALAESSMPLELFVGKQMNETWIPALLTHASTLQRVEFLGYLGNAASLMTGWPADNKVVLQFQDMDCKAICRGVSTHGYAPKSLELRCTKSSWKFVNECVHTLSQQATGLERLNLFGLHYTILAPAAPVLATCGLVNLNIVPEGSLSKVHFQAFWEALAVSTTLLDLQLPNQLSDPGEVAMVGKFLKVNRSVRRISFDSESLLLDVNSVKALRAAFYGNKKVTVLQYPKKARANTMAKYQTETNRQLAEVSSCKRQIKAIFKRHYSKYNPRWRDHPNRLKLPLVERIRVAKRKIGRMQRDSAKIAKLLDEIQRCVASNKRQFDANQKLKESAKLARREKQLSQIAVKKQKVLTNLVTKMHKAKERGRQKKSAKTQLPRAVYYQDQYQWPTKGRRCLSRNVHSLYRCYNDLYNSRFHWYYGYYGYDYSHQRNEYLDNDTDECIFTVPPVLPEPTDGGEEPGIETDGEATAAEIPSDTLPTGAVENEDMYVGNGDDSGWSPMVGEDASRLGETVDPWSGMDDLLHGIDSNVNSVFSPAYLSQLHEEAAELGPDVIADISPLLDAGAAIDHKIESIADSMSIARDNIDVMVDSAVSSNLDIGEMDLGEVPDYVLEAEADDAVAMYAGAGPRDLDDGGPSFNGSGMAALSGSRRQARTRKVYRDLCRIRKKLSTSGRLCEYKHLMLPTSANEGSTTSSGICSNDQWPNDLVDGWIQEVKSIQINAMSNSDLFVLPESAIHGSPRRLLDWSASSCSQNVPIEVVLVTQCSVDRLMNLEEQLAAWTGKACVTVYVKHDEHIADQKIVSCIENAQARSQDGLDVSVLVLHSWSDEEAYPINLLRNVALLDAKLHHVHAGAVQRSAVLLVDVDFRPSANLYAALHCPEAARTILKERHVVICPAFEVFKCTAPTNILELKCDVEDGLAEGFHLSHFPWGHGPTCFDTFWSKSSKTTDTSVRVLWDEMYPVKFQKLFEPYIVMSTADVPLYDERFQGYGLNKVSHLASVARGRPGSFTVLPGVFLAALAHQRSDAWAERYGSQTDEALFNQLWLKGLYHNFCLRLEQGKDPVVSDWTRKAQQQAAELAKAMTLSEQDNVVPDCSTLSSQSCRAAMISDHAIQMMVML